jgi:hypothetical protein
MSPSALAKLMETYREIEARGWPTYAESPARCMTCAREFLARRDELLQKEEE